jgi:hypothetical protein
MKIRQRRCARADERGVGGESGLRQRHDSSIHFHPLMKLLDRCGYGYNELLLLHVSSSVIILVVPRPHPHIKPHLRLFIVVGTNVERARVRERREARQSLGWYAQFCLLRGGQDTREVGRIIRRVRVQFQIDTQTTQGDA